MRTRKHVLGAAIAAMVSTMAIGAWAQAPTPAAGDPAATAPGAGAGAGAQSGPPGGSDGRGPGGHHGARGHHGPRGPHGDPARFERRMEQRIARMVTQVGGTAEQRDRIVAIMKTAAADRAKLREQGRGLRGQGLALLKAPTIDRAALEQQRSQRLALFDAVSRRMTTAIADAAEVLTPEQRVKFAEMAERRGFGGHGRGGPGWRHGPGGTDARGRRRTASRRRPRPAVDRQCPGESADPAHRR